MKKTAFLITFAITLFAVSSRGASDDKAQMIAAAVLPLPEQLRNASAVVQLNDAGIPKSLRDGTNGMVCIADRPSDKMFDVRCYHESFIAVVYRAFQLNAQGIRGTEAMDRIEGEISAGKIKLPKQPTAGYRCLGPASAYDASTNSGSGEIRCWQSIHFPYRTAHEMGLMDETEIPADMRSKMPYVMSSGKYWAHVMIEHPTESKTDHSH